MGVFMKRKDWDSFYYQTIRQTENCQDTNVYAHWRKWQRGVIPVCALLALCLANWTLHEYGATIDRTFSEETLGAAYPFLLAVCCLAAILVVDILLIFLHEWIHYLAYPHGKKHIVFSFPYSISVAYKGWLPKKRVLLVTIAPFPLISLLAIPLLFLNKIAFFWVLLLHTGLCSSDIHAFLFLLHKVPANAEMLGNCYRADTDAP